MGKLIEFPTGNTPDGYPSFDEFQDVIEAPRTSELIQVSLDDICQTSHESKERIRTGQVFARRMESPILEMGTVFPHPQKANLIITHENFPAHLIDSGIERQEALRLAATSVGAFSVICQWYRGLRRDQNERMTRLAQRKEYLPNYPRLWDGTAFNPTLEKQDPFTIIHRMAARVALESSVVRDFDTNAKPPLPVHIASLLDPFNELQVRSLHQIAGR